MKDRTEDIFWNAAEIVDGRTRQKEYTKENLDEVHINLENSLSRRNRNPE